jgi:putative ABC transport system permease protein
MRSLLERRDLSSYEDHGFYADSSFLEVFSFKLKEGDAETALDQPNAIVLTEELAAKYFEEDDPMGELMILNNDRVLQVTGILEPIPKNSHLCIGLTA